MRWARPCKDEEHSAPGVRCSMWTAQEGMALVALRAEALSGAPVVSSAARQAVGEMPTPADEEGPAYF